MSLASWALLLALARLTLAFLENQRTLNEAHGEARTDSLTGLRNRRGQCVSSDSEFWDRASHKQYRQAD